MGAAVPFIPAIAAVIATGASIYTGERQREAASAARKQTTERAEKEVERQTTEREQLKRKQAGRTQRELSQRRAAGTVRRGAAGTRLTGPGGIDPSLLNLARNTLLG